MDYAFYFGSVCVKIMIHLIGSGMRDEGRVIQTTWVHLMEYSVKHCTVFVETLTSTHR